MDTARSLAACLCLVSAVSSTYLPGLLGTGIVPLAAQLGRTLVRPTIVRSSPLVIPAPASPIQQPIISRSVITSRPIRGGAPIPNNVVVSGSVNPALVGLSSPISSPNPGAVVNNVVSVGGGRLVGRGGLVGGAVVGGGGVGSGRLVGGGVVGGGGVGGGTFLGDMGGMDYIGAGDAGLLDGDVRALANGQVLMQMNGERPDVTLVRQVGVRRAAFPQSTIALRSVGDTS